MAPRARRHANRELRTTLVPPLLTLDERVDSALHEAVGCIQASPFARGQHGTNGGADRRGDFRHLGRDWRIGDTLTLDCDRVRLWWSAWKRRQTEPTHPSAASLAAYALLSRSLGSLTAARQIQGGDQYRAGGHLPGPRSDLVRRGRVRVGRRMDRGRSRVCRSSLVVSPPPAKP